MPAPAPEKANCHKDSERTDAAFSRVDRGWTEERDALARGFEQNPQEKDGAPGRGRTYDTRLRRS
jgi:hypothetical protein